MIDRNSTFVGEEFRPFYYGVACGQKLLREMDAGISPKYTTIRSMGYEYLSLLPQALNPHDTADFWLGVGFAWGCKHSEPGAEELS